MSFKIGDGDTSIASLRYACRSPNAVLLVIANGILETLQRNRTSKTYLFDVLCRCAWLGIENFGVQTFASRLTHPFGTMTDEGSDDVCFHTFILPLVSHNVKFLLLFYWADAVADVAAQTEEVEAVFLIDQDGQPHF